MNRYIDKDKLIAFLTSPTGQYATCEDCCETDCVDCIREEVIKNFSEADVVQVKHGKWIDVPLNCDPDDFAYKYNLRTKCSVCDYVMPREYPRFKICPCCGAKMDGDDQCIL